MTLMIRMIVLCLVCIALQGCTEMAVAGAGLAYDHYRVERSLNDRYIAMQIESAIYASPDLHENTSISIAVFDGMVLIAGEAKTQALHDQLEQIVGTIPDIKHLYNFVTVGEPISVKREISDTWITAKIKSSLLATRDIDAGNIKVVTEDGTTYLLGKVEPTQAEAAIFIARQTRGVTRVVTLFEYVHTTLTPVSHTG